MKFIAPVLAILALLSFLTQAKDKKGTSSNYWAYQSVQKITPPNIQHPFIKNPIDAFILHELQKKGIQPNQPATLPQLQRRLSYDLTGLPPKPTNLAWKELVDHYLNSSHFGEKFASHWLDLVRYAETNGFERDSNKPYIWRYRDYIIRAFNADKPYNQLILEQLAGDQIPNGTLDSHIATGFMALMQRDDEPADGPQAHADAIGEIVDVAGEAFLGTTMACAKCHDHKGDPISQADYFSMMAFFDGIQPDLLKKSNKVWTDPKIIADHDQKRQEVHQEIEALWKTIDQTKLHPFLKKSPDPKPLSTPWTKLPALPENPSWSLPSFDAPAHGFSSKKKWKPRQPLTLRAEFGLTQIPSHLLIYLENHQLNKLEIYLNGTPIHQGVPQKINNRYFIPLPSTELTTGKNVIGLITQSKRPKLNIQLTRAPLHQLHPNQLATIHPKVITSTYGPEFAQKMRPLQLRRQKLNKPLQGLPYLAINENSKIDPPRIHKRGNVHAQGKEVPIAFPAVLDPHGQTPERTRLALAQWMTSPQNPLTARVWVNRLWQYCFSKGLVDTANDFGTLGTGVSNQALLDYLANELIENNWSTKHILRLILNSSTYQLSTTGKNNLDPTNKLHWRQNPRRLTAEEIWDTFLTLTNQLNLKQGGPPVRPKMPDAVLATSSRPRQVWPPTPEKEAHRRAVYIHVKRSIQLPILANFDAPQRDISCPTRFATTVPTQSLTMINSERMNQFADRFASRLQGDQLPHKISHAFQLATSRKITEPEKQQLLKLASDLQQNHNVPKNQILPRLCLLILNLNETIYLD